MRSGQQKITLKTLQQAQQGHEAIRADLAKQVQEKIYAFFYRSTLDEHLSEDLCQDTLLVLLRSLDCLELTSVESFWGWVYRTALGQVQHHFRRQGLRRLDTRTRVNTDALMRLPDMRQNDPIHRLWQRETVEAIVRAVSSLKMEYRAVIGLRCAEELSFAQIATIVGGSQARAKLLFYRARKAMQRQLRRQGLERSQLLGAITVFITITRWGAKQASAQGLVSVSATSLQVGTSTVVLGTLTSKIAGLTTAAVLAASVTGWVIHQNSVPRIRPARISVIGNLYSGNNPFFTMLSVPTAARDPDNSGWQGFNLLTPSRPVVPVDPLQNRPMEFFIIVPQDHMLELTLPAPLVDGPDADIYADIHMWQHPPRVVLSDGADREIELAASTYAGSYPHGLSLLGYDLNSIQLDFEPTVLRFYGVNDTGPYQATAFHDFMVRVAQEQSKE